jgi:SAM-dependent methyltransferase
MLPMSTRDVYGRAPRRLAPAPPPEAEEPPREGPISRRSLLRLGKPPRPPAAPDYEALTERERIAWGREGHEQLLRQLEPAAGVVADLALTDLTESALDVGAGDGNLALAAAARGVAVSACDLAPEMVERGRVRTAGQPIEWTVADVQRLPYPDASFDAVLSTFGACLAPAAARAAGELVRVARPGGRVALAGWVPRGLPGRMDELVDTVQPRPRGAPRPSGWGVEAVVRRRLERLLEGVVVRTRTLTLSFPSADAAFTALARAHPLDNDQRARLRPAFDRVLASCNNLPPSVQIDARYLVAIGVRPG